MNKLFVWILLSLAIALGLFLFFGGYLINDKSMDGNGLELATYFQDRMVTLAVADIGQPIEGFDSELLVMAYPALVAQDFDRVQTLEGHYEEQNGSVVFVHDAEGPVSSAERTVSKEGYVTLLSNVSIRLGLPVFTETDVDVLIEAINTGERLGVKVGQSASAFGITLTPLEVLEDSRCPADVECIQVGTVRVRMNVEAGDASEERVFVLNEAIKVSALSLALTQVLPQSQAGKEIQPTEYVLYFQVNK